MVLMLFGLELHFLEKEFMNKERKQLETAKILVFGCGNMGEALVKGFSANLCKKPANVYVHDIDEVKTKRLSQELGVRLSKNYKETLLQVDIFVLAVKPKDVATVLKDVSYVSKQGANNILFVSVVAGLSIQSIQEMLGFKARVLRVMPNVCCLVSSGMSGVFAENTEDAALGKELMSSVGEAEILSNENEFDAVTGVSGSGPAYVFTMIEAMADGAVKMGLSREKALKFATQTVYGAASMIKDKKFHPAQARDMVCSPAGTTIAGMHVLEQGGFRASIVSAIEASAKRSAELIKK